MFRAQAISFLSSAAAGLSVIAIGRIVAIVYPSGSVWSIVAVVAGIAAVVGFGVAERARTEDREVGVRRVAGVLLLGGIAVTLVLLSLYAMPFFRPTFVARDADVAGPIIGLLFFPVLLMSIAPRMIAHDLSRSMGMATVILGALAGGALTAVPVGILAPAWALAAAVLALQGAGVAAAWPLQASRRGRSFLSVLALGTVGLSSSLAFLMSSELYFVIGSV